MLKHLKEKDKAKILEQAVEDVIRDNSSVTYDLKPDRDDPTAVGTKEITLAIIKRIKELQK